MTTSSRVMRATLAATIGVGLAACVEAATAPPEGELVVDVAQDGRFEAHLTLDGETIGVASVTEDGTRVVEVDGDDGTEYAVWTLDVATLDITGTMGGRSFGTYADHETDMDPAYWREVEGSRTGTVLSAVSFAARTLVGQSDLDAVAGDVEAILHMSSYLREMAHPEEPDAEGDGDDRLACDMVPSKSWDGPVYGAYFHFVAHTGTAGTCLSSSNCAALYNSPSGEYIVSNCRPGTASPPYAIAGHWITDYWPHGRHCRRSKHWTNYRAARWLGPWGYGGC